ncbi:unnamed protein product [Phytophthora fragariaefolia]|uniref:Unnamed protein product n=1 Tax=Phytophthora fragariaefolia TaxID=1490495 RepID=A0A9W7CYU2_9STRA|nr:unnamed protein product [Phytophthora fragariaefolia]
MHQQRRHGADDVALSAYSADTEDYYAILPSDESLSDVEDAPPSPQRTGNRDPVDELATVFASASSIGAKSAARNVLTPIGSLSGRNSVPKESKGNRQQVAPPAAGVFDLGGGQQLRVSPRALEQHNSRRTQLQAALDAVTDDAMGGVGYGEAPFRFVVQQKRVVKFADEVEEMEVEETSATDGVEVPAPKKNDDRTQSGEEEGEEDDSEDETLEPDPLYDEQLDDADEQWVQTNLRKF